MSDLVQIQTFIEVVNGGSFAEASRRLSLPRSTVSARVKGLEKRLNTRLFNRNTRNVSLTSEGQTYLNTCQQALALLSHAEDELISHDMLSGKIRLSVPVATSKHVLAQIIADFRLQHPNIEIEVVVSDEKLNLVANNIDLAIRGRDAGDLDLIAREFYQTELAYFASPKVIKALGHTASLATLEQHLIFAPVKGASRYKFLTQDFEMAFEMACFDQGVVCLPVPFCKDAVQQGRLIKLQIKPLEASLSVYLVYANRQFMAKRIRYFIDFLINNKTRYALI